MILNFWLISCDLASLRFSLIYCDLSSRSEAKAACADEGLTLFPAATSEEEISIAALYIPMFYDIKYDGTNFVRPFDDSVVGTEVVRLDMFHSQHISVTDCGDNRDTNIRTKLCDEVDPTLKVVCVEV